MCRPSALLTSHSHSMTAQVAECNSATADEALMGTAAAVQVQSLCFAYCDIRHMVHSKQCEMIGVILSNRWSLKVVQEMITASTYAHFHCKPVLTRRHVTHASDCAVLDTQDTFVPGSI